MTAPVVEFTIEFVAYSHPGDRVGGELQEPAEQMQRRRGDFITVCLRQHVSHWRETMGSLGEILKFPSL